ncbi:MAG: dihydroorotase [Bacteroidetes bacterium]|nr:MAG: dihydroorotase [Bacteroidota bacterium]
MQTLLKNARIVNEGKAFTGAVLIDGQFIKGVFEGNSFPEGGYHEVDLEGKLLIPGVIDDQVHFREPGLTHKADIYSESRAAVAGGTTSFMDMPNNNPPILSQELLESKYQLGAEKSLANYSFYMGTSNDNLEEVLKTDPKTVCGIKIFMGSSTGNMLVDNPDTLSGIFSKAGMLIATHCEDEQTIKDNSEKYKAKYGDDISFDKHPEIRSAEACYKSSALAVSLAKKYNTRLHILHLTTAKEMQHFSSDIPLEEKRITAEVCVHHLSFNTKDYAKQGSHIKCNPAVKTEADQKALIAALKEGKIDIVATDHAPHTLEEKSKKYWEAPSGLPLVQHSLVQMLEFYHQGIFSLEEIVEKMAHNPAKCFQVSKRGFIRTGYYADLVVVDLNKAWTANKENTLYKVQWSPFDGKTFQSKVIYTYINGSLVYDNGTLNNDYRGMRILFDR